MRPLVLAFIALCAASPAFAGNTSSNSSSNSSNGVHTRVDTIIRDDDRGRRRIYERRIYRDERAWRAQRRYWRD
ncbi:MULTISPECIES: hypothetical protein [unclassified Bosea (in: a-proteobacteria)]|uniref:hypothetical protein n=1 Tax=unclassified Bosea (in: a-proteobacteria) TaxID=2653178 RepID=UPI000F74CB5A|nr:MULTISPECIES: hypothetical protein [unclassified Bosea (in: a-proteobacteria)]AZO76222.1 hypothetical protein BLM15_00380 [Bosea sp. Tri-49]RXT26148.1 hypothetical protein B5U98_06290 [Bosea sp. Tri-39]RXT31390.1 hypothetical protein B5U99_21835 [Bosea sp. Tri-54]